MKKLILLALVAVMEVGCTGNRTKVPVKFVIVHHENEHDTIVTTHYTIVTTHYDRHLETISTEEGDYFTDVKTIKRIE